MNPNPVTITGGPLTQADIDGDGKQRCSQEYAVKLLLSRATAGKVIVVRPHVPLWRRLMRRIKTIR